MSTEPLPMPGGLQQGVAKLVALALACVACGSPIVSPSQPPPPPTATAPAQSLSPTNVPSPGPQLTPSMAPSSTPTTPSASPAPVAGRYLHVTVWTGQELVVWGGITSLESDAVTNDGAAYDPQARSWRLLPDSPLAPRFASAAVWTGREVIIWGGAPDYERDPFEDGAAYDPRTDTWRTIAKSPLGPRASDIALWTGDEMLVWGGAGGGDGPVFVGDGAAYDPDTDSWRPILPPRREPTLNTSYEAVWTGSEMIIWGGDRGRGVRSDGWAFDPSTDAWRKLTDAPLSARFNHSMLWTGNEVLVWGGASAGGFEEPLADGAAYDPAADSWQLLPVAPITARGVHVSVWADDVMIVWGGRGAGDDVFADGAQYSPGSDNWQTMAPAPILPRLNPTAISTGVDMLLWGGLTRRPGCDPGVDPTCQWLAADGVVYLPHTDTWRPM